MNFTESKQPFCKRLLQFISCPAPSCWQHNMNAPLFFLGNGKFVIRDQLLSCGRKFVDHVFVVQWCIGRSMTNPRGLLQSVGLSLYQLSLSVYTWEWATSEFIYNLTSLKTWSYWQTVVNKNGPALTGGERVRALELIVSATPCRCFYSFFSVGNIVW